MTQSHRSQYALLVCTNITAESILQHLGTPKLCPTFSCQPSSKKKDFFLTSIFFSEKNFVVNVTPQTDANVIVFNVASLMNIVYKMDLGAFKTKSTV